MLNKSLSEDGNLSKFFGLLKNFNGSEPIKPALRLEIEEYFKFKWSNDHNQALMKKADVDIYEQLPQET